MSFPILLSKGENTYFLREQPELNWGFIQTGSE
jgi:hypothetical protein